MEAVDTLLALSCCSGLCFLICLLYVIIESIRNMYVDGVEWP
jgi:hypothetical protein